MGLIKLKAFAFDWLIFCFVEAMDVLGFANLIALIGGVVGLPFAIFRIMRIIFPIRKTSTLVEFLSYSLFPTLTILHLKSGIHTYFVLNIIRTFSIMYILTLNYQSSKLKRLSATFFVFVFIGFAEIIFASLAQTNSQLWQAVQHDFIIGDISVVILHLLLPFLLIPFSFLRKDEHPKIIWISLATTATLFFFMHASLMLFDLYPHFYISIALSLMLSFMLILYLLERFSITLKQQVESAIHEQEKLHYHSQYELMKENIETTRTIKHDLNLHLNSLNKQLQKSPEAAQNYLNKLLSDNQTPEIYSNTGNIAFDAPINYKLGNITIYNDLLLDVLIKVPTDLKMESTDVTSILGNLLDNAINAVAVMDEPFIRVDVNYQKGRLLITVENSFDGVVQYKGEEIVSRNDKKNRGIGLKSVRRAVERYDGQMTLTHEDGIFVVEILIYV